jgi:hypothetical protein
MNATSSILLLVVAELILLSGCNKSQQESGPTRTAESSLKQISILFGQYTQRHRGETVKTEAEFRKFIAENGERSLKMAAVSSVDELLTSPRDNEPFQIRYGMKMGPPGKSGGPIVAYEKTGLRGSRFVVDSLGSVKEVSQSELDELLKN